LLLTVSLPAKQAGAPLDRIKKPKKTIWQVTDIKQQQCENPKKCCICHLGELKIASGQVLLNTF
jgi:hypothetical protein